MGSFAENCTVEELKALGIEAKPDYIRGGFIVSAFSKNYTVEELEALGFEVEGDPKEIPLFDPEEYQEAREEMGKDFIEMERIDDYIEPDYYHNGTDGTDLIEMMYRTVPFEQFRGFMKGNIMRYVTRYDRKNGPEDLTKAHTFLDRLRDYEERHGFAKRLDEQSSEDELDETHWKIKPIDASTITAGVLEIDDETLRQALGIKEGEL